MLSTFNLEATVLSSIIGHGVNVDLELTAIGEKQFDLASNGDGVALVREHARWYISGDKYTLPSDRGLRGQRLVDSVIFVNDGPGLVRASSINDLGNDLNEVCEYIVVESL